MPIWDAEAMSTKPLLLIAGESYGTISFLTTTSRMCPSDALHLVLYTHSNLGQMQLQLTMSWIRMLWGGSHPALRSKTASDRLPIRCTVDTTHLRYPTSPVFPFQPLNWTEGEKSRQTLLYAKATDDIVRPMLNKGFHSIEEIDYEIKEVCQ